MEKEAMRRQLAGMQQYFEQSTKVLDEADSNFAPKPGTFTAAQQVAHVAHTIDWFIKGAFSPSGFDMNFEAIEKQIRGFTSLEAARKWFRQACADAQRAVEAHSEAEWSASLPAGPIMGGQPRHAILGGLLDHTAHHRGALTVYSRLVGKVPPMPYMEG